MPMERMEICKELGDEIAEAVNPAAPIGLYDGWGDRSIS